ncbi:MAG: DUF2135 domain-containing protein [Spirochaetales bacterium]|nr:MAG: DUF2135 domain-containing protein [Spirochaetales bacterium]
MRVKHGLGLFILILLSVNAFSQQVPAALFVTGPEQGGKPQALSISAYHADVRIAGLAYAVSCTITFYNPGSRQAAGDFYFPLPEDSVVSGYALDINGVLVDGVPVEKQKARQVFEKIVRQGLDPGLAEWTKGNTFKTRVFPIPPRGTRTIRVSFTGAVPYETNESLYRLPLNLEQAVDDVRISITADGQTAAPKVRETPLPALKFTQQGNGYTAEVRAKKTSLPRGILLALSTSSSLPPVLEKDGAGTVYFTAADIIPPPPASERVTPKQLMIYWDASGSRNPASLSASFAFLDSYLKSFGNRSITAVVEVFRNEKDRQVRFTVNNGNSAELIAWLKNLPFDGGTQLGDLSVPPAGTDLALLFSDGLSTLGQSSPPLLGVPLYCFAEGEAADYNELTSLALRNNGEAFNLSAAPLADTVDRTGRVPFSFMGIKTLQGRVDECYPLTPEPVGRSFRLSGRLVTGSATIALQYGRRGIVERETTVTLNGASAAKGRFVPLLWAQAKLKELLLDPKRNRALITDTGKEYGLVTPGTSLIVLENLDQYVENRIAPPESLPDMRKAYFSRLAQLDRNNEQAQVQKLKEIIPKWQDLVAWWNRKFTYPPNFRYREESSEKTAELDRGEGGDFAPRSMEERPAPSAAPAMEPPADISASGGAAAGSELAKKDASGEDSRASAEPEITIQPWDPDTPYLAILKKTSADKVYAAYLQERKKNAGTPAFYLDCADYFISQDMQDLGVRILSNLAELKLEDAPLLRILAHRLSQIDRLALSKSVFEEVLLMRPEEPQSYRDLALILARLGEYTRAIELLYKVVLGNWDRFEDIELIALVELNTMIPKAKAGGQAVPPVDSRLVKLLDTDIRISLTWDTDLSDMDLWVTEPSSEKAYYAHNETTIGGRVSSDFTEGYGPEEYMVKKAMKGPYKIEVNYYSSSAPSLSGSVTLQVEVFTNYGRASEKRQALTVRLRESADTVYIGEITF